MVRLDPLGNYRLLAIGRDGDDALVVVLADVQASIRSHCQPVRLAAILLPDRDLSRQVNLVNTMVAMAGEVDVSLRVDRGVRRELIVATEELPVRVRFEERVQSALIELHGLGDGLRILAPDPAQCIRQNGPAVLAVVAFGADDKGTVITCVLQ